MKRFHRKSTLTTPWIVPTSLLMLALLLGIVAQGDNTLALDAEVTKTVQQVGDDRFVSMVVDTGNSLGFTPVTIAATILLLIAGMVLREWRDVAFLALLVAFRAVGLFAKRAFESPRPDDDAAIIVGAFDGLGYPSGHAMTATVALGGLAALVCRRLRGSGSRWFVFLIVVIGIGTTAFARIWTGAHWFSDTVGGTLLGAGIVMTSANLAWGRSIGLDRLRRGASDQRRVVTS